MSWPQWPMNTGQPSWPQSAVIGQNPQVPNPTAAGTSYTPEQWAAMQQQNWQQWMQWQQQYQQWQQQYGEQYQKSMTALTGQPVSLPPLPVQPPLPPLENKSIPPLPEAKPPLPPEEPPKNPLSTATTLSSTQPPIVPPVNYSLPPPIAQPNLYPLAMPNMPPPNLGSFTTAPPSMPYPPNFGSYPPPNLTSVPPPQNVMNKPPETITTTSNNFNSQNYNKNFSNQNFNDKNWQQNRPGNIQNKFQNNYNNQQNNNQGNNRPRPNFQNDKRPMENQYQDDPKKPKWENQNQNRNVPNPEMVKKDRKKQIDDLIEAEKNFDKQFVEWEAQFNKWKEQNAEHPDKEQYKQYEAKWENWRNQLLDRREQMRKKRLMLLGQTGVDAQKEPEVKLEGSKEENYDDHEIKSEEKKEDVGWDSMQAKETPQNPLLLPPKEQRVLSRQRGNSKSEDESSGNDFLKSNPTNDGGIPGLDLVDSELKNEVDKKEEVEKKLENTGPDFDAISKGINTILGDEKLISMLSNIKNIQNKTMDSPASEGSNQTSISIPKNEDSQLSQPEPQTSWTNNKPNDNQQNWNNNEQSRQYKPPSLLGLPLIRPPNDFGIRFGINQPRFNQNRPQGPTFNFRGPNFGPPGPNRFQNPRMGAPRSFGNDNFLGERGQGVNFSTNLPQGPDNQEETNTPQTGDNLEKFQNDRFQGSNFQPQTSNPPTGSNDRFQGQNFGFDANKPGNFDSPRSNFDNFETNRPLGALENRNFGNNFEYNRNQSSNFPPKGPPPLLGRNDPGFGNRFGNEQFGQRWGQNSKVSGTDENYDEEEEENIQDMDDPFPDPEPEEQTCDSGGYNRREKNWGGNGDNRPAYPNDQVQKPYSNIPANKYSAWDDDLILKPATVIDYNHKSLYKEEDLFMEPLQTFDYCHSSENVDKSLKTQWIPPARSYLPSYERYNEPLKNIKTREYRNFDNQGISYSKMDDKIKYRNYRDDRPRSKLSDKYSDKCDKKKFGDKLDDDLENISGDEKFVDETEDVPKIKTEVKTPMVTMIEDLLTPPGRERRPPRLVIIMRGPPGSGKTFLAKLIKDKEVENGGSAPRILSLDDYFMVESEEEVVEDGRKIMKKKMIYEYEESMENAYRQSLEKAFKKTITDGYFPFIILDCINDKVKHFNEMWSYAKQNGFQVYVCQMELELASCTRRNTHFRSEIEIEALIKNWEPTPSHYLSLDATSLLQAASIPEVEMEEVSEPTDEEKDDPQEGQACISKWERMEHTDDQLARLDGINKPLRHSRTTMEDYLQLEDEAEVSEARPGQKRVRWADLEEKRRQEKIRAIGFVVGQTDWNRMMDPTQGSSALTQTKYIERVRRY